MIEKIADEKQFTVEIVNRLVTLKMIKLKDDENRYVITDEGKKFRRYMLDTSKIDIDEKLQWINQKIQSIEFMEAEKLTKLIQQEFFTQKQITQIKYCKDYGQPINLGLTRIQARILLGETVSKDELANDDREGF